MPIISMSLDENTLLELDSLPAKLGFAGRSEAIRAGVKTLIAENKGVDSLSGRIKSVLLMVHDESDEEKATAVKHKFDDIIATQVHSNLKSGKCLEIFVLDGKASRVREMFRSAQANRKVEYLKLVVP
ncbi:MAG: CopG family ribbon-helix-helix protein [Candidatus Micrarchaeota archaeon]|nr:CopG family ribbon-helix-helix protein [Candidatus Micrarchaeota archaeon]